MMKELWQLIKMLFSSKPGDFDTPELLAMKHYPFKGYRFMMWCGRMIYRAENKENIDRYMQTYAGKESLTHETIHLRQAQVIGSWVKYYWRYFVEWIKGTLSAILRVRHIIPSHTKWRRMPTRAIWIIP